MALSLTTIRYYTATDPYYYVVDNRPLTDLETNQNAIAGALSTLELAEMTDTDIVTPKDGDVLLYSGVKSEWLNVPMQLTDGLVDGNFDFWSLGTSYSVTTSDAYTADMWIANGGTGGAATVSQHTATLGAEPVGMPHIRTYQLQFTQTAASSGNPTLGQKLPGVKKFNGQYVTFSGYLQSTSNAVLVTGIRVTQNFGTGGSPSTTVVTNFPVTWTVTSTETRFSAQLAIPSILGTTMGTAGGDYVRFDLILATGVTFTLYASQFQIDLSYASSSTSTTGQGGQAWPFRYLGVEVEQGKVERFCEMLQVRSFGTSYDGQVTQFKVPKRTTPAFTVNSGTIGTATFSAGTLSPTTCIQQTAAAASSNNLLFWVDARP